MTDLYRLLGPLAIGVLLAACREVTGPGIEGRWAATGIELIAQPSAAELRLVCTEPAQVPQGLVPDSAGTVRFSTQVQPVRLSLPYHVDFLGQLVGDTLAATVTWTIDARTSVSQSYLMLRDGDSGFDKIFCAF
jgi:hypothetical protein